MNSKKVLLGVLVLVAVLVFTTGCKKTGMITQNDIPQNTPEIADRAPAGVPAKTVQTASFSYEDYDPSRVADLQGAQPFAMFFHADWCPICRKMEGEILSNLDKLPVGRVILKVDYDTETALKKEYGITTQSTVVFFGADGSVVEKVMDPSINKIAELLA